MDRSACYMEDTLIQDIDLTAFSNSLADTSLDLSSTLDLDTPNTNEFDLVDTLPDYKLQLEDVHAPRVNLSSPPRKQVYDVDKDIVRFLKVYDQKMQEMYTYTCRIHKDIAEANNILHRRAMIVMSEVKRLDEREKFIKYREDVLNQREERLFQRLGGANVV